MNEQLIIFETAKLAKKKGFDLITNYSYDGTGQFFNQPWSNVRNPIFNPNCTQSLLQRWLLEVHSIHIEITFDDGMWLIYVGEFSFPDSSVELVGNVECDNFEDAKVKKLIALEKGLQEALKLIVE